VLGDFELREEIGRGGMGVVYKARQKSLNRTVALKVLPLAATMDPRRLQRFHNEAQAAANLHHTNIVPVYFVGSERGVHYYAMQFIEGRDLASVLVQLRAQPGGKVPDPQAAATVDAAAGQPTTLPSGDTRPPAGLSAERSTRSSEYFRTVARLGIQAAEALDHAHQMGIVHRDIKPANLLVDAGGRLWVTDFGLAQMQSDARLTMTGDLVGTLRYMSPEQALAKRVVVDHRTDVYSLGATLYELLTLRPAFAGEDRQELLRQIAFDDPIRPRRLNRSIPPELETIVLKAMEKNPQERYGTAQELADDLRRHLEDKPIRARRPSWRQVAGKWARRHKAVVWAATAVMLVAAVLGGGVGVWRLQQRATAASEAVVALEDSDRLQKAGRLPEALLAIRRAELLRAAGLLNNELAQRVRDQQTDLEMLATLEDIRLVSLLTTKSRFDLTLSDLAYQRAFKEYGIDVLTLEPTEATERIKSRGIRVELAAALHRWALVCKQSRPKDSTVWKSLLAITRGVDGDESRNRIRDAVESKDREALIELAASEDAATLPPITVGLLAVTLRETDAVQAATALLRKAQCEHPDDLLINFELAYDLDATNHLGEAIRFYTAALALLLVVPRCTTTSAPRSTPITSTTTPSPHSRKPSNSIPSLQWPTSTSGTFWPTGASTTTPSPNSRRPSNLIPRIHRLIITWARLWRRRSSGRKPSPSTAKPSNSIPRIRRRTTISATRYGERAK
jgi:serine/threonine protein kinase